MHIRSGTLAYECTMADYQYTGWSIIVDLECFPHVGYYRLVPKLQNPFPKRSRRFNCVVHARPPRVLRHSLTLEAPQILTTNINLRKASLRMAKRTLSLRIATLRKGTSV